MTKYTIEIDEDLLLDHPDDVKATIEAIIWAKSDKAKILLNKLNEKFDFNKLITTYNDLEAKEFLENLRENFWSASR